MCRGLRDREAVSVYKYVQRKDTVEQSEPWSSVGSHGYYVFSLVVCDAKKDDNTRRPRLASDKKTRTVIKPRSYCHDFCQPKRTTTNHKVLGDFCHEFRFFVVCRKSRDSVAWTRVDCFSENKTHKSTIALSIVSLEPHLPTPTNFNTYITK